MTYRKKLSVKILFFNIYILQLATTVKYLIANSSKRCTIYIRRH